MAGVGGQPKVRLSSSKWPPGPVGDKFSMNCIFDKVKWPEDKYDPINVEFLVTENGIRCLEDNCPNAAFGEIETGKVNRQSSLMHTEMHYKTHHQPQCKKQRKIQAYFTKKSPTSLPSVSPVCLF